MQITKVKIGDIKINTENPRSIKDSKFNKLVKSIKEFPEMLQIRPIVVNEENVILGGNMRYKACQQAGLDEVYIIKAKDLSEDQQKEFLIKDNSGFGEWDWDILANEWDHQELMDWGVDLPALNSLDDDHYTTKIDSPIYETKIVKPKEKELYDINKYNDLINDINKSNISEEIKEFLRLAATRHIKFNYSKIADYYAHSEKETQSLIEDSALIIIDYDKAIEKGFVNVYNTIENLSEIDG